MSAAQTCRGLGLKALQFAFLKSRLAAPSIILPRVVVNLRVCGQLPQAQIFGAALGPFRKNFPCFCPFPLHGSATHEKGKRERERERGRERERETIVKRVQMIGAYMQLAKVCKGVKFIVPDIAEREPALWVCLVHPQCSSRASPHVL